ncbi:MAG TPA: GYD domain-containing protein [Hyphomicrobiaceae bacterium]|nr:GYD domain-containing protein [Hyphomicrobiaceae bacterium]
MASYVMLANFTEQGIRNVKDSVKRAETFKEAAKAAGVTVKDLYWTLGEYDIVVTAEAKDEMAVTALGLTLAKAGNVRTQTLRAFGASEMSEILGKVK